MFTGDFPFTPRDAGSGLQTASSLTRTVINADKKNHCPTLRQKTFCHRLMAFSKDKKKEGKQLHHSLHSKEREFAIKKKHHNIVLHRHPGMSSFLPLFQCCTPLTPSEGSTKQTAGTLMQQTRQPEPAPISSLSEKEWHAATCCFHEIKC